MSERALARNGKGHKSHGWTPNGACSVSLFLADLKVIGNVSAPGSLVFLISDEGKIALGLVWCIGGELSGDIC